MLNYYFLDADFSAAIVKLSPGYLARSWSRGGVMGTHCSTFFSLSKKWQTGSCGPVPAAQLLWLRRIKKKLLCFRDVMKNECFPEKKMTSHYTKTQARRTDGKIKSSLSWQKINVSSFSVRFYSVNSPRFTVWGDKMTLFFALCHSKVK